MEVDLIDIERDAARAERMVINAYGGLNIGLAALLASGDGTKTLIALTAANEMKTSRPICGSATDQVWKGRECVRSVSPKAKSLQS